MSVGIESRRKIMLLAVVLFALIFFGLPILLGKLNGIAMEGPVMGCLVWFCAVSLISIAATLVGC